MRLRTALVPLTSAVLALGGAGFATACTGSPSAAPPTASGPAPDLSAGKYADWPSYHGGALRHGFARSMPAAKGRLRVAKLLRLDGEVYASPLVVHGTLIVATEHNTVYAFGPRLHLRWKRQLGRPSPASERPCGNIDPLGITGTPVYDRQNNSIFVAPQLSGNPSRHQLVALNFTTGRVKWRRSLDFKGVDPAVMQQRGALALDGARVLVPFGGLFGDCGNYKGRVVGRLRTTGRQPRVYTVPTAREAGIWTPPGPTVDAQGSVYVAVGNGASGPGDRYDHSDSVLKLSPQLKLRQSFSPTTWASDNASDLDLGSQGPALVGNKWVFTAGKSGTAYVLRRARLGGIGGQVSQRSLCTSFGGTAVRGNVVYVPCTDGVRAVRIDRRGRMHVLWHASSSITGSPVIGGRRVWALDPDSGVLHALGLKTGRGRGSVNVGAVSRFATPAIYGPSLFVPTLRGVTVVATS